MKSKHAGQKNTFAIIGIIVSVISMIIVTLLIVLVFFGAKGMIEKCRELGPGTHQVGKSTYTCNINGSTEIKSNSFNE